MEATTATREQWTFAQKGIVVLAAIQLLWALAGFVAEPNFAFGEDAPTEKVLGVDFNGNHALAGLLLFAPAFYFALRPEVGVLLRDLRRRGADRHGIWALFSEQPGWVFTFPDNTADAIFHLATGVRSPPSPRSSSASTGALRTERRWCRRRAERERG